MSGESSCVRLSLKTCPVCKTHVFNDMDTCYNCMYSFGSNPSLERKLETDGSVMPDQRVCASDIADGETVAGAFRGDTSDLAARSRPKQQTEKHQVALKVSPDKSFFGVSLVDEGGLLRCASGGYETPEDCIKEYETAFLHQEGLGEMKGSARASDALFDEFLVEFRGFLGKFILDRKIGV